jgi:hypothetical protein
MGVLATEGKEAVLFLKRKNQKSFLLLVLSGGEVRAQALTSATCLTPS